MKLSPARIGDEGGERHGDIALVARVVGILDENVNHCDVLGGVLVDEGRCATILAPAVFVSAITVRFVHVAFLFDLQFFSYVFTYQWVFVIPYLNEVRFVGIFTAPAKI